MERNSKLEAARRLRGWTLEVASQKIGVHPRTLRRWETGKSRPQGFRVFKISQVYETTPSALGIASSPLFLDEEAVPSEQRSPLAHISEPALSAEDLDLHLMSLILQRKLERQNLDYQVFQRRIDQCIKDYDEYKRAQQAYDPADPTRQQALRVVASVPIVAYLENITPLALPAPPEDILTHCASAITACWHMGQEEDLKLARSFVTGYLILLSEVFSRVAYCRQAAAALIAQACLLRTMLAYKLEGPHAGVNYYARALAFSLLADTAYPSAGQSLDLTTIYGYGKQPAQALRKMAESIWLLKPAPPPPDFPLVRDYLQKISTFYRISGPRDYEDGDEADLSDFHHFPPALDYAEAALNLWDGITYHELGEYAQTLDSLRPGTVEEPVCDGPEQVRMEFLPNRALASLRLHDMDQAITTLRASIPQALSLGGEQELLEARKAYHLIQFILPADSLSSSAEIKDLLRTHD
jgi:transcriptional regulator with XRE-family HTH domain